MAIDCTNINLKRGSTGSKVKTVQTQLKEYNFYVRQVDGTYGRWTENAVRNFQRTYGGLSVDGVFGSKTCKAWNTYYSKKKGTTVDNTIDLSSMDCTKINLKMGSKGSMVTLLQTALKKLNYYTGKIDGSYGVYTRNAVKKLQKATNHTQDGIFGPKTCPSLKTLCASKGISKSSTTAQKTNAASSNAYHEKIRNAVNTALTDIYTTITPNVYIDGIGFVANSISSNTAQNSYTWNTVELMGDNVYTYKGHVQPMVYEIAVPLPWNTFMATRKYLNMLCNEPVQVESTLIDSDKYFVSYTYKESSKGVWVTLTFNLTQDL